MNSSDFKLVLTFFVLSTIWSTILPAQNEFGFIHIRIISEKDSVIVKNAGLEFRERGKQNSFCILFTNDGGEIRAELPCKKDYFITVRHPNYVGQTNKLTVSCLRESKRIDFTVMKQPRCPLKEPE